MILLSCVPDLCLDVFLSLPGCVTMSTTGPQATNRQNVKEIDSMKESISDIINQLQDIDPARLSFSPFLDLDTQISLAPVSDSPESSVEELHSSSHSVSGSQRSLEPPPAAADQPRSELSLLVLRGCHGEWVKITLIKSEHRKGWKGVQTELGLNHIWTKYESDVAKHS